MKQNRHGKAAIFSERDWAKLMRSIQNPKYLFLLQICYYTGERWGAILKLQREDILEEMITFRARTRKASPDGKRRTRQVPIHPKLREAIALEPTGMHYAQLWANVASERGIPIYWIGHKQLARFREELGFEDKNDEQDAFAIACYYWRYRNEPRRFVRERAPLAAELRALGLRLAHLNRCRSPHLNYLRQLLSWQFPEAAEADLQGNDGRPTALLNFIADGEGTPR